MLHDHEHRLLATDPSQSFIVEAPAGSGKTEILTQRFLRLLQHVQAPEQIIALTFTRKAAHEMRERVLSALRLVSVGTTPASAHQALTFQYAQQALEQDRTLGWDLLRNANRLRIMTIDALCQMLIHAIPLHSNHFANITTQPQIIYYQAARNYVHMACQNPNQQADLQTLLQHLDNRQDILITLFAQMLAQRDQWLAPIFQARNQTKTDFEDALAWIEQHELARFVHSLPVHLHSELLKLIQDLLTHADLVRSKFGVLANWRDFQDINAEQAEALAGLLLTSNQTLRKSFDHHIGLKRDTCSEPMYSQLKATSKSLFEELADLPGFTSTLIHVSRLPHPEYAQTQWQVLQALFQILPLLVAHLTLAFQAQACLDFPGVAHQAKLALGSETEPSDLTLYLDHQIQHVLIDEFQDTSIQQFELLTQLVQGWEAQDGRTLFIVGDPMQSIYRFRAAEVGLFLRAKSQGIGPVPLQSLQLSTNFRSSACIVDWVNHQFSAIFPTEEDIETGAVSYHKAVPVLAGSPSSFVQAQQHESKQTEAQAIAHIVQTELTTHADSTVAILVRSRSQLRAIVTLLRQKNIPFQGIDIDLLAQLPHVRDMWSLTQAFLMPANRLAWLALLRSPWVGIELADLLIIAKAGQSIYEVLSRCEDLDLSVEGLRRGRYLYHVFHTVYAQRHHYSLYETLKTILKHLHIESILSATEQEDLDQYWDLLQQFTVNENIADYSLFEAQLARLYSQKSTPSRLQIMTIHKSKGLEFDCVILPGLGNLPQSSEPSLIRWLKLPREHQADLFLISPIKAIAEETCRVYDYLAHLDAQKSAYELQRLLYVAVTRAKQRLYLLDHHTAIRKKSFRHMLTAPPFEELASLSETPIPEWSLPSLQRLPISYYADTPGSSTQLQSDNSISFITPSLPRLIGIVTHAVLQWICTYHPRTYADIPWYLPQQQLRQLGLVDEALRTALTQVQTHIHAFFHDPRGQWIAKQHEAEHNEYAILGEYAKVYILDRTFIEQRIRWIVDFKTGQTDSTTQIAHRNQLERYAALFPPDTTLSIRCGLYYLNNLQWIEWESLTCNTSCT